MTLAGSKVLVTGAGGFIGSHLVEHLVRLGADVRAMVHYNSAGTWGNLEQLPRDVLSAVDTFAGDLADPFAVRRAVEGREVVLHLGALIAIPYSYRAPASYVTVNVQGTVNVLEACREAGVARVVHTSTSETYGTAEYTPIDESHPLQGQSPYSASKIAADKMAEAYHRSFGLPVATIRPFNTFGPRQSARAIIPTVVSQAIDGDRVELGALTPVRDLTFVEDTVRGFVAVATSEAAVGQVVNVGNGKGITIGDLVGRILRRMGRDGDVRIVHAEERVRPEASEVFELVCDARKAESLTGWRPQVSLDDGLDRTIAWIRDNRDRFKADLYNV